MSTIFQQAARAVFITVVVTIVLPAPRIASADWFCERRDAGGLIEVYVLAGQSNMVGLGAWRDVAGSPRVDTVGEGGAWVSAHPLGAGEWASVGPGFGLQDQSWIDAAVTGEGASGRFGPEIGLVSFLRELDPDRTIGIIKHARPATTLASDWQPGVGRDYRELVDRVVLGVNALEPWYAVTISAVLWMQGESDADREHPGNEEGAFAAMYRDNLETFIATLRGDLAARGCVDDATVPVILGRISAAPVWEFSALVRSAQLAVAQNVSAVGLVDTDALGLQDEAHYDSGGVVELGRMFASAFKAGASGRSAVFSLDPEHHYWSQNGLYCRLARWRGQQEAVHSGGMIPWALQYEGDCGRLSVHDDR